MIDRDLHRASALVVEGNALLRSVTTTQLHSLGLGQVTQCARLKQARELIEQRPFDVIVCSREFEGSADNGQDLLDELRREHLLPHRTVFLMVTRQATYHHVVEAAEAALDAILLSPYSEQALAQRLAEARHRKRELADVLDALDAGDTDVALARALRRYQERQPYAGYCGRLVAELLLQRGRPEDARRMFDKLALGPDAVWARLGAARALLAAGDPAQSRRLTEALLQEQPALADGHELLGRIALERGDVAAAGSACRQAAQLTPGCLLRLQQAGALSFHEGRSAEARSLLEAARTLGLGSKLFDPAMLTLLTLDALDRGDRDGVARARRELATLIARRPGQERLDRLAGVAAAAQALADGEAGGAIAALHALLQQRLGDGFGLEAAQLAWMVWARLPDGARDDASLLPLLNDVGLRHCTSKAVAEMLVQAARRLPQAQTLLAQAQGRVAQLAESAMERSLAGDAAAAVTTLLDAGEAWRNARLLELAEVVTRRHAANAAPDAEWVQRTHAVRRGPADDATMVGVRRSARLPGGLQARSRAAGPSASPAAAAPAAGAPARATGLTAPSWATGV